MSISSHKLEIEQVKDLQTDLDNTVTIKDAQTIKSLKTFDMSNETVCTNVIVASQDSDTNTWAGSLVFRKGELNTGFCESFLNKSAATKDACMQLTAHQNVEGTDYYANLRVGVRGSDGSTYALAPTPPVDGSNDNQILTNAWFNNKIKVVSTLPASPDPNVFYFIPE